MILAGDIGGTKTNIAFFEDAKRPDVVAQETFPSRAHAGLEEIVRQFISQHALRVRHALRLNAMHRVCSTDAASSRGIN